MTNKNKKEKYYWIKLKDSFLTSEKVDYLISQNGGQGFVYVCLYQCLCLKTINTGGELITKINEIIIPYDIAKLKRDLKWFSVEQLKEGLELFIKLGLVYTNENNRLAIAEFDDVVGYETYSAIEKRMQRKRIGIDKGIDKGMDKGIDKGMDNVYLDIRDKRLENKILENKRLDIRYLKENTMLTHSTKESKAKNRLIIPTLEEVRAYIQEKGYSIDPEYFLDRNNSIGWVDKNGNKYKDRKAVVRTWAKYSNSAEPKNEEDETCELPPRLEGETDEEYYSSLFENLPA